MSNQLRWIPHVCSVFSGFQSYVILTTEEILLEVENSSRIISYYLVTYGLSFTIVAISLGIDPSSYTINADACGWMEQNSLFYVTFMLPCLIYLLVSTNKLAPPRRPARHSANRIPSPFNPISEGQFGVCCIFGAYFM